MFENLRKIRREKDIKVIDIAKKLGLKTEGAFYKKETGAVPFTLKEAKIVADMFGMSIEEVFLLRKFPAKKIQEKSKAVNLIIFNIKHHILFNINYKM